MTPFGIARITIPVAGCLFVLGVVGNMVYGERAFAVVIPAGILIVARGVLMLSYPDTVLARLAQGEADSRFSNLGLKEHKFGAILCLVIGAGWTSTGVLVLL